MTLSSRTKNAIKPALAVVIAYGISLGMGWENPYWAGFAVAMISLSTAGQSLNKGTMRMLGTLVAATVALAFMAWFPQDRWWFITVLSIYIGFGTYMFTGNKRPYFWWCSSFVVLVIGVHAAGDMPDAFNIAVLRVQQTGMGILVYTLVTVLLWPTSTRDALDDASRRLASTQRQIFQAYRGVMQGQGTAEILHPLQMQAAQQLTQMGQALNAAETDSYEVWEMRHQWRRFNALSNVVVEAFERWRVSFPEIKSLDLNKILPNLTAVYSELDDRFVDIARLLTDDAPTRQPQRIHLVVDHQETLALTYFQKAAVAVTEMQLNRLEMLSRALIECVHDMRGDGPQAVKPVAQDGRAQGVGLDPDRLQAAARVMATLWAAFLIWFYVNPPGHAGFVQMATIFTMASAMNHLKPATVVIPFFIGSLFAGVLYIFVMPHLSSFSQLGAMLFGAVFAIYYLFWQPHQGVAKLGAIIQLLNVIGVQSQQTYDFASYANTNIMLVLAGMLAIAIWYLPPSPRPEKAFMRLLARFYRHSEHLISHMALDGKKGKGWAGRWKTMLYQNDILALPAKLAVAGSQIDHRIISDATPEQVQNLVTSLQALALRLKDLGDARQAPQATLIVRHLQDDIRHWRMAIEALFLSWFVDPAAERDADLQDRLVKKMRVIETRIDRTLSLVEQEALSKSDYENFYRLIGSYRGFAESIIDHAKLAGSFNWGAWREERF